MKKFTIGSVEWCALPDLHIPCVKVRVDSGAATSSLHAYNMRLVKEGAESFVEFELHPVQKDRRTTLKARAKLVGYRMVRTSSGMPEKRFVIRTTVVLGEKSWEIELTLTNRDSMGYRMLLGREAILGRAIIDPEASFVLGSKGKEEIARTYAHLTDTSKKLRIALLSSQPKLYSNQRLIEAGKARGHQVVFVNIKQCYMNINASTLAVHFRDGEKLKDIDAVIPRIGPQLTYYGCAILRQMQAMGPYCFNSPAAVSLARDKLQCLQILAQKGLPMPITGCADSPRDTGSLIKLVKGAPLVIKLVEGPESKGIVLAETKKAAESVINTMKSLRAQILVQEYIEESKGSDIRCIVLDGKVIASMERMGAPLNLGGKAKKVKLSADERRLAISATRAIGLDFAGVTLLRTAAGPKIIGVNATPGLEGIESTCGVDIADLIIQAIEKNIFNA